MRKAWILIKFYINSLYGISGFFNDLKDNRKAAFKKIAFIVLMCFAFSGTIAMFVAFNIKMFDVLKTVNQQGLIITIAVIVASMITLVFGMIGIIATYFVEKEGDIVLSMPIKAWHILAAKFTTNYIYEGILSLIIMATGFMVYGIKSDSGPVFYIVSMLMALLVPVIPLTIGYIIVIPLMRAGSILRKKDFTMIISGIIAIGFAVGFQFLSQAMVKISNNPVTMMLKLTSQDGMVSYAKKIYYPSVWATYGITKCTTIDGIINLIFYIGISLMLLALLIVLMSGVYATSIEGSQEVTKSKKYTAHELKATLRSRSTFRALLNREIKLMNREPVYLLNGPLIILIMPLIFGIMLFAQKGEFSRSLDSLRNISNANYYITLCIAGIAIFLGISVNITSTCISREGKAFDILKSMPIDPEKYLKAKLIHGLIFGALAAVMCNIIGELVFGLGALSMLLAFVIAILMMTPVLIAGIVVELTWPKLIWDNPQKAMKQNMNGVIIIVGSMCVIPLVGFLVYKFLKEPAYGYLALMIFPFLATILSYKFLMKYGKKRFYEIEL